MKYVSSFVLAHLVSCSTEQSYKKNKILLTDAVILQHLILVTLKLPSCTLCFEKNNEKKINTIFKL